MEVRRNGCRAARTLGARWLLTLAILGCAWSTRSPAIDPGYLERWPDVTRVLDDNQGKDPDDTLARRMAALHVLRDGIEYAAGPRRWHGLTADEQRLRGAYYVEAERIRDHMHSTLSNDLGPGFHPPWREPPLQEWYGLQWSYEGDFEFRERTLRRYVPAPVIAQILAETPPSISRPSVGDSKGVPGIAFAAGAALLLFLIVKVVRRLAARRRAESVDTGENTAVELPEGYAELTAAQRDELAVAGRIVLDSLEPYMLAARPEDRPFPMNVMSDNKIVSFLLIYCREALKIVRGIHHDDEDEDKVQGHADLVLFHLWFVEGERMSRLFGAKISPRIARTEGDAGKAELLIGVFQARQALAIFSPVRRSKLFGGDGSEAEDKLDLSGLRPPLDPPATPLHPLGPDAARGQRFVLGTFSRRLQELSARA